MSWKVVKLGELIEIFSVKAKDFDVDVSKLEFFGVSNTEGITLSKYAAEDKANDYKIMEKGCFAYNPYRVNVGSIAMLEDEIVGLISPAYVVFKVKEKTIIPELLLKFLKSSEGLRQIKLHARGTVRQALRFSDLCEIKISLPDYEEQLELYKSISNTEIESNILTTELTHQLSLVKQLRQAFLREAMQGKLVEQNPNDEPATELLAKIKAEKEQLIKEKKIRKPKPLLPVERKDEPFIIPKHWLWCRLGDVSYITSGSTPKSTAFVNEGIPYLKMYNLRNQKIDFFYRPQYIKEEVHNGQLKRCRAYPGDVIMNIVGPPLGKIAIIPESLPECNFNQAAVLIRPIKLEINKYIFWYLNEMSEINAVETKGVAGQNNISVTQAHNMRVPLPPLFEQKRIVAKLDELMAYCDSLEESIKNSQTQNEMLLGQVLREALEPKEKEVVV